MNKKSMLTFIENTNPGRGLYLCECGNKKDVRIANANNLSVASCGCLLKNKNKERLVTHGLTGTSIYRLWKQIKNRCFNSKDHNFKNYGARGITMCKEWAGNAEVFYMWCIENGYKKGLEIDRIENSGNYEPENCRFVTRKINANNKRNNRFIEHGGKRMTLSEWADFINISPQKLSNRINKLKWSLDRALFQTQPERIQAKLL